MRRILLILIFLLPVLLLAQGFGTNPAEWFLSIPALSVAVLFMTDVFKNITGNNSQYASWGMAIVIGAVGYFFNLGIFDHVTWWVGLIYALSSGLMANGLFDWGVVQKILALFKLDPETRDLL